MKTILVDELIRSDFSAASAARALGVSYTAIHKWSQGEAPLPAERARQLEDLLDLPERALAEMESDSPTRGFRWVKAAKPATMLDFLLRAEWMGMQGSYPDRCRSVAGYMDVSWPDLRAMLAGDKKIPLDAIELLCSCWTHFNPVVLYLEADFDAELAYREVRALVEGLHTKLEDGEYEMSWDELEAFISATRALSEGNDLGDEWRKTRLDNGKPTSVYLKEKVREIHGRNH